MQKDKMKESHKFILEMGPLGIFFLFYKFYDIIYATGALMIASFIAVSLTYFIYKTVPIMPIVSAVLLGFFGTLTIISQDELFIKVKPTIVNLLFFAILFGGWLKKKSLLKYLMGSAITMNDQAWIEFSLRWSLLFLILAIVNEVIWRNFSTDFWVSFKVFGMMSISIIFMLLQIPFLKKNIILEKED